jgi:hypothetical protein
VAIVAVVAVVATLVVVCSTIHLKAWFENSKGCRPTKG